MAQLHIIGSGSKGNSYIIETSRQKLLLELGVAWAKILEGLNYKIDDVVGCLVSHKHTDHAQSIPNALMYQLPVYSCQDVADSYEGVDVLELKHEHHIGEFSVQPIPVEHNVPNYAYLIEHDEIGRLLFFTDCTHFPYKIKNLNHIMAEANYDNDLIIDRVCEGDEVRSHNEYHCEINDTIFALGGMISDTLSTIVLIHLSDGQSDEKAFSLKVTEATGITPYIATKNQVIEINKEEF